MPVTSRRVLWLVGFLSVLVYALNLDSAVEVLLARGVLSSRPDSVIPYLIALIPLSLFYLAALKVLPRENGKSLVLGVLLFTFLFRLPLIFEEPSRSSDVYRYLWDGRVQVVGQLNPYLYPPEDAHLAALRDEEIYPQINRKSAPTIYPAGAQLLFRFLYSLGIDGPAMFKAAALLADAITIGILLLILRELGRPLSLILIYAWNPLVVHEIFQSGHLDAFMLPPIMAFVYFVLRGRLTAAGGFLGLAAAMKLVPALLLLAVPLAKLPKLLLPFSLVFLCAYLPYASAGKKVLGFLPTYFSDPYEIFNPGLLQLTLFDAAEAFSLPLLWVRYVLLFAFGAVLFLSLRRFAEGRPEALIERACVILGAHLLFIYPAFHPWYLLALVPFLALSPSPAWIYLSLAIPLSYLKYLAPDGLMPGWVTWAQFAPLYVLLGLQYARIKALDEWRYRWQPGSQRTSSITP